MKTEITDQLEDELNELKLRIAKMNARRNAQIHLLQKNLLEEPLKNKMYSKSNDIPRRNYYKYPLNYYWSSTYPWKHSSIDDLLTYEPDNSIKRSVSFLSEKDLPEAYKILERRAQSNIIKRLKQFVYDQEREITGEFVDKLLYPQKIYSPKENYEKYNTDTKLYSSSRESPFLKPLNKSDNFYKRYNSFMKRILKPFRKPSPLFKNNESYKKVDRLTTSFNYSGKYAIPSPVPKFFPSKISKPSSPIKSPLNDLDTSYLKPWYRYSSPFYRNYLPDYEYIPKSYRIPRDIDSIIRDMEFENRRTYPFMSTYPYRSVYDSDLINTKYDPYESDSYLRSKLPTWKQYYYTQKLRSKPSNERFLDYYDPYRDFFCDAASAKSDDLGLSKNDSEINSICDDNSLLDENTNDIEIIDEYRDLIYEDIIKNLRNQQAKNSLKNRTNRPFRSMRIPSRYNPRVLRNDRSLYNYRIPDPSSSNYSWSRKSDYMNNNLSTDYIPYKSKYNLEKTEDLNKEEKKFKSENANPSTYESTSFQSKYNIDKPEEKTLKNITSNTNSKVSSPLYQKTFNDVPITNLNNMSNNINLENRYDPQYKSPPSKTETNDVKSDDRIENVKDDFLQTENLGEKESEIKLPLRRGSIYSNRVSPNRQQSFSQLNLKQQSIVSNPPSPVKQLPEQNIAASIPMSRKNSFQQSLQRGSIRTSSIEEENPLNEDTPRKFSKEQPTYYPEYVLKNSNAGQNIEKNLYSGNLKESFDEQKEEKPDHGNYIGYSRYQEPDSPSLKEQNEGYGNKKVYEDYPNQDYRLPNQYQQYSNFSESSQNPKTETSNMKYEEQLPLNGNTQSTYSDSYYPDPHNNNYKDRFYDEKYNDSVSNYKYNEEYQNEKKNDNQQENPRFEKNTDNYKHYETKIPENEENPHKYATEKRPSLESYYPDHPRQNDYENYKIDDYNDDYFRNPPPSSEKRNSNYQDYRNTNRYNESSDTTYNEPQNYSRDDYFPDQTQSNYHEDTGNYANENTYQNYEPESRSSFENYSINSTIGKEPTDQNYPYSSQNPYENQDYEPEPNTEKISQIPERKESIAEAVVVETAVEPKNKDRKKSVTETAREVEPSIPESTPKEIVSSRRASRTATSLAQEKKKLLTTEKAKLSKTTPTEPKFKRTPSIKTKTLPKRN